MVRAGSRRGKAQQLDAAVAHFHFGRDFRQQRHAVAVGDHLHDGRERSGAEAAGASLLAVAQNASA